MWVPEEAVARPRSREVVEHQAECGQAAAPFACFDVLQDLLVNGEGLGLSEGYSTRVWIRLATRGAT